MNKQTIPLQVKRIGINGEGIGYYKRKAVFVPFALPKEKILCEITKEEQKFIEGKVLEIEKASPDRVKAPCPYYEHCGGCQLQHLRYSEQLKMKKDIIIQSLTRYIKDFDKLKLEVRDTIGLEEPYYYRNRAQMPVRNTSREIITGLYEINSNKLVDIDTCMIQEEVIDDIIDRLKVLLTLASVKAYDRQKRQGTIRHIAVRYLNTTEEAQVVLVLENKKDFSVQQFEKIANEIMDEFSVIKSFFININKERNSHEIYGPEFIRIKGKDTIDAKIGELVFELSPASFFQLNTEQTKVLYDIAIKYAKLQPNDVVIDAYCGVGTIGQYLAKRVKEVYGVESIGAAIDNAKQNAQRNNITNAHYEAGRAEVVIPKWIKDGVNPSVLIMDPPRSGVDDRLLELINKLKLDRVVYVSCNPSTLAKDLNQLLRNYTIKTIQPVDMFPQTSHVESVVLLVRK